MFTVLISLCAGVGTGLGLGFSHVSSVGWAIFWGFFAFLLVQFSIGYYLQKKMRSTMTEVQEIMKDGQRRLQAKVNGWQHRPPGSIKAAQDEIQHEQQRFVNQALLASEGLDKYRRWAPTMGRQIATLRLQLYWMIKDFKNVDKQMPHALFFDPLMVCIKIARMYMKKELDAIPPVFEKAAKRVAYGKGDLLFALYSWILVKENRIDDAHKVLARALEKSDNQILKTNKENLANNRIAHFNNSGFGDQWYALQLEEPKVKMQRQQPRYGRPF